VIAQTNPLITAAAVTLAVIGSSMAGTSRMEMSPGQLSGVLYSVSAGTQTARNMAASMPKIGIAPDPTARRAVASGGGSPSRIRSHKRSKRQVPKAAEPLVPTVAAVAAADPAPVAVPAVAPPPAPKPTFPPTFAEIDDALRASSTVQAINFRIKKGGVSFRLTQVGRVGDRYVIRYAIANEESSPFFLSIVNVAAGGKPILSETAGTYSCPTGQEVYGVVHFSPAAVAGKNVVVELVQSGGEHRRFSLTADYAF
jgi:hypothetical protein